MKAEDRIRFPHQAKPGWWYEDPAGIAVYYPGCDKPIKIRWKELETAIARAKKLKLIKKWK